MNICESWKRAGEELGFDVKAPYMATTIDGAEVLCIAHLPDFGSSNGMVVGAVSSPTYEIDICVKQIARELGKYCSFINARIYEKYDREVFKEALNDWGFGDLKKDDQNGYNILKLELRSRKP